MKHTLDCGVAEDGGEGFGAESKDAAAAGGLAGAGVALHLSSSSALGGSIRRYPRT